MEYLNKNIIMGLLAGVGIFMILIAGCTESGKEENKNVSINAGVASEKPEIKTVNNSIAQNISVIENVTKESTPNVTEKTPEPELNATESLKENVSVPGPKGTYIFTWDDVPGKGNAALLKFLNENMGLYWADNANIKKSCDNRTITVQYGVNAVGIEFDEKEGKLVIETIKVTNRDYLDSALKKEDGKLNVYLMESPQKLKPGIMKIKFDFVYGLVKSNDASTINSKLRDIWGVRYASINFMDKNGEVIFNTPELTTETILKEASFIKTPGGVIIADFTMNLTEELNCTQSRDLYCCGKDPCKRFG